MTIEAVIAKLEGADLDGLREEWRRRYGAPPRLRSKTLLRNVLAWIRMVGFRTARSMPLM